MSQRGNEIGSVPGGQSGSSHFGEIITLGRGPGRLQHLKAESHRHIAGVDDFDRDCCGLFGRDDGCLIGPAEL